MSKALSAVVGVGLAATIMMFSGDALPQERLRTDACTRELGKSSLESINPADSSVQLQIAETCRRVSATARGVDAARARFYSGRAFSRAGMPDDAIRQLEAAVNTGQDFEPVFRAELRAGKLELVQAYLTKGRVEAARLLLASPSLNPNDPGVAYQRALLSLAELGPAGEESAFGALKVVFAQDGARLGGAPGVLSLMTPAEISRGRSWLFRLGLSLGQASLRAQGRDGEQRRSDAQRAIDFLGPAAAAIDAACPDPAPIDCANGIGATDPIGALEGRPAPTREQLLDVFFQIGIAHLKAAGLEETPGFTALGGSQGANGVGALDCSGSQLEPDAAQHFQYARYAFDAYTRRSSASAASSADARWGLGCTILANLPNVSEPSERQRQIAQAIEQLRLAPRRPLTMLTLARAQVMQGQLDSARASFKQALDLSGTTTRCPSGDMEFPPGNRDALASRIYVEVARTRYAYNGAPREADALTGAPGSDLHYRTITEVAAARPASLRDSEADLRCAIFLNHENVEARLTLGHIYLRLGSEPSLGLQIDRPPYPKAEQVLQYFARRQSGSVEGNAEGLFLASRRLTLAQQNALVANPERARSTIDRSFLRDGEQAVNYASQAFSLAQRPQFRRQACQAQILFGQTAEQGFCAAAGQGEDRAETLLYEGMYWLRRGQREAKTEERLRSWSRSIQAFNRGVSAKMLGQVVESDHPSQPPTIDLGALLSYGQRYVLACRGINYNDGEQTSPEVKEYYRLSGIPLQCGGRPS
jgi:tetratricopeptide (TPR) repeat protein